MYEGSPRITEATCAQSAHQYGDSSCRTERFASRQHDAPGGYACVLTAKNLFFFQPASRVMQEETPIKNDSSRVNTCDYLIVKPATCREIWLASDGNRKTLSKIAFNLRSDPQDNIVSNVQKKTTIPRWGNFLQITKKSLQASRFIEKNGSFTNTVALKRFLKNW